MSVEVTTSSGISVTVTTPASSSVTVTNKGPKGDTGETGATGASGATGAAGAAGTTFTAGDGLDLSGTTLTADLKYQGGIGINSGELQVSLSDPYSAGTLPVTKGGTGATSFTDNAVLFGNGGGVVQEVDLSVNGAILVGGAAPARVTGANLAGAGLAATTGNGTLVLAVETLNQDTTGTAAVATAITVADESSDTTCFPLFVTAATGDLPPKTGTNLTFNSSTGDLTAAGAITAKTYSYISCGFYDDIGTTIHYLPLNGAPSEQGSSNNSFTDWVAPCAVTVLSAQMRFATLTGDGNLTMTVLKSGVGSTALSSLEAETVAVVGLFGTNNNDVVHFLFDGASVAKGETMKISIQADADVTGTSNTFVTIVLLMDWNDRYTVSSAVITS
jgi:hypothetical protein